MQLQPASGWNHVEFPRSFRDFSMSSVLSFTNNCLTLNWSPKTSAYLRCFGKKHVPKNSSHKNWWFWKRSTIAKVCNFLSELAIWIYPSSIRRKCTLKITCMLIEGKKSPQNQLPTPWHFFPFQPCQGSAGLHHPSQWTLVARQVHGK